MERRSCWPEEKEMSRETCCYSLTICFLPATHTNDGSILLGWSKWQVSLSLPSFFLPLCLFPPSSFLLLSLRLLTGFWPFSRFSQTKYIENSKWQMYRLFTFKVYILRQEVYLRISSSLSFSSSSLSSYLIFCYRKLNKLKKRRLINRLIDQVINLTMILAIKQEKKKKKNV